MDLYAELEQFGIDVHLIDKTYCGKRIDVAFNGHLRDEQSLALEHLLLHDIGILSGTTAFGKTVVAIKLIAERKVNTLILVDKVGLLRQWQKRLSDFLIVNETLPEMAIKPGKKKGRKKKTSVIGQIGAGKNASAAAYQPYGDKEQVRIAHKN